MSVIVPVYNVEKYLADCLQSLISQAYENLEIIVVDDGSPDNSFSIADTFASLDHRIRIVRRENGGLGAARNTGIAEARGDYITFVDSDDEIPSDAYQQMIASATQTGSEIVVGAMVRSRNGKTITPEWVKLVHSEDRLGIKAEDFPEILRDFYSPNKIYNRYFWQRQNFAFREGVLFEDQPVITNALTAARSIDVLKATTYRWLIREDGSSLSQNMYTTEKIQARFHAVKLTKTYLDDLDKVEITAAWKWTLLQYHFPNYLGQARSLGDESYEAVIQMVSFVVSEEELLEQAKVSPQNRVLMYLALTQPRTVVEEYLNRRGRDLRSHPVEHEREDVYSILPFATEAAYAIPRKLLRIPREDLKIESVLDKVRWLSPVKLEVSGWAYLSNTDPMQKTQSVHIVVRDARGEVVRVPVAQAHNAEASVRARHHWVDYGGTAFVATVDLTDLLMSLPCVDGKMARWSISVEVKLGTLILESPFGSRTKGGSAQSLSMSHSRDRVVLRPKWTPDAGLQIFADRRAAVARSVQVDGSMVAIQLESPSSEFMPIVAQVSAKDANLAWSFPITPNAAGHYSIDLDMNELVSLGLPLYIYLVDAAGVRRKLHVGSAESVDNSGEPFAISRSVTGVMYLGAAADKINVSGFSISNDGFFVIEASSTFSGDSGVFLEMVSSKQTSRRVRATKSVDGLRWSIPVSQARPGTDRETVLPQAWYRFVAYRMTPRGNRESLQVLTDRAMTEQLPLRLESPRMHGQLLKRGGAVGFQVQAAHSLADRSMYTRTQYLVASAGRTPRLKNAIYFQCLIGDCATDSQLAIHNYLRINHPEIETYWGVVDYSVPLPDGAIPVVIHTESWFEVLATCKYICVNHELPPVYEKKPGQVVVQTYHGHPFKLMGLPRWESQNVSSAQQARNLAERDTWDYLLSPSPEATKMYRKCFPISAEIVEAGHPRNDVLVSDRVDRRSVVRKMLGIRDDQTAVLYAPTWRDYESTNPWVSRMVELLNPYELSAMLGDGFVVLLRGHPAHQRHSSRPVQQSGVVVVTDYPEINDLIMASDVGVFDYSSVRFDYSVTKKPMIFFVPDEETYFAKTPPLIPYGETAPGPRVIDNDGLAEELMGLNRYWDRFGSVYDEFVSRFNPLDDGRATERFVEKILRDASDSAVVSGHNVPISTRRRPEAQ
ncbi:bifunctional glycosyltransferase/CDP-glycerol:glycerophosphate glycerophosphotransferase [Arthrobacter sulfonylureivorans]|uniref:Bifunctional glycosyltransferase family 2 protein/CDP-glycerol:glycerophosphate glycerophosphotransferase n=1 Tax=Arthrobacter sulfonylureivorans TaxID=2486855 RepID=A0ABY3WGL2_9MICC|nr:CDP-glycerol glycerophosphotransferase family protein [Arthrobacter sulfonylureivorans]UNK47447.1 bifunctional glycosyltransferase family 2 protein/CDP-glycerol:glycerophosphate glycerophosphotransferase [Arthrobacter sulfonylureivorans]